MTFDHHRCSANLDDYVLMGEPAHFHSEPVVVDSPQLQYNFTLLPSLYDAMVDESLVRESHFNHFQNTRH